MPRTSRAPQILRDATPSVPHRRTPGRVAVGSTASRSRPFTLVVDHVDAFELRADRRQGVRALDELHSWRPPENARRARPGDSRQATRRVDRCAGEQPFDPPILVIEATRPAHARRCTPPGSRRDVPGTSQSRPASRAALRGLGARRRRVRVGFSCRAWPRYFRATSLRTYFVPSAVFIRVSFVPLTSVTVALPPASEPPAIPIFTELVPRATSWK